MQYVLTKYHVSFNFSSTSASVCFSSAFAFLVWVSKIVLLNHLSCLDFRFYLLHGMFILGLALICRILLYELCMICLVALWCPLRTFFCWIFGNLCHRSISRKYLNIRHCSYRAAPKIESGFIFSVLWKHGDISLFSMELLIFFEPQLWFSRPLKWVHST